jgi:WD40 repeat protein
MTAIALIPQDRRRGPDGVLLIWQPGDVILDLYEVRELDDDIPCVEGGMGRINRVWHRGWQQDLAVKSISPEQLDRPGAVENFQREAEVWVTRLHLHPNLVFCHYVRLLGGLPRVFMEYVDGGNLVRWVETGRPYEGGPRAALLRILDIAIQMAWGLHAIHAQGLVHQDVKPRNVMMTRGGIAKLTDFGIARARAAAQSEAGPDGLRPDVTALSGTRSYQSPEQAAGRRLTPATDIWSWGVSVLDLFLGRVERGFGAAAAIVLEQYVAGDVQHEGCPEMPAGVVELLRQCFQGDPEARPRSILEAASALRDVYAEVAHGAYPRQQPYPAEALADSLNNQALSLFDSLDKRPEAEQKWQEALRIDPHHPEAVYNSGVLQWRSGQITDEQLLWRLQEARTSCADPARVDYLLGLLHLERKDSNAAIQVLSQPEATGGKVEMASALEVARAQAVRSSRHLRTLKEHTGRITGIAWALGGGLAVSSSMDGTLQVWKVPSGRPVRTIAGHLGGVSALALSPDGSQVVSGGEDEKLRWWDLASGHCWHVSGGLLGVGRVTALAWSSDGRFVASASTTKALGSGGTLVASARGARLWDASSGRCVRVFEGHFVPPSSVALSPDGSFLLVAGADGVLDLWEIASGRCVWSLGGRGGNGSQAWSPDDHFALRSIGDLVRLWREMKLEAETKLKGRGPTTAVAFSPDGRYVLAGCGAVVRVLEAPSGLCQQQFKGHTAAVRAVAWGPDGDFALSGSDDRTVRLWEVSCGRCLRTFTGHSDVVTAVAWSPDGRHALSGSADARLGLWRLSPPPQPMPLAASRSTTTSSSAYHLLLAKAREAITEGRLVRAVRALRRARQEPGCARREDALEVARQLSSLVGHQAFAGGWQRHVVTEHTSEVTAVAISPDGRCAVSADWDGRQRLWEVPSGRLLRFLGNRAHGAASVAFSPNGNLILSGNSQRRADLSEAATGRCLRSLQGHQARVSATAFSPDGRFALTGSHDRTMRLWDIATGKCRQAFRAWAPSPADILPTILWLVVFLQLAVLGLVGLETEAGGRIRLQLPHVAGFLALVLVALVLVALVLLAKALRFSHRDRVTSVAISPDGRLAVSGSADTTVRLWNIATGRRLRTLRGHHRAVTVVAWTSDGRSVVSAGADRALRVWVVSSGRCRCICKGHTGCVTSVAISADGRFALSGSEDHTLRLWELSSGHCLRTFEGHTNWVTSVAFSPDGRLAASGSADRTVRLWGLDWVLKTSRPADWDDGARPYLEAFLTLHIPYQATARDRQLDRLPLSRTGKPTWTEADFRGLLTRLGHAGYGWLRPEAVHRELMHMAAEFS